MCCCGVVPAVHILVVQRAIAHRLGRSPCMRAVHAALPHVTLCQTWQRCLPSHSGGALNRLRTQLQSTCCISCNGNIPAASSCSKRSAQAENQPCLQGSDESGKLHQRLTKAVATALKKAQGRASQLAKQLDGAQGSEETSKQADLIMAHLHK